MRLRYFLLCFLYILFAPFVIGQASTIKINEFLIEPTPQAVELLNTGSEIVDLSNWFIDDSGGVTYFTIPPDTQLYPNACLSFTGSFNFNRTTQDTVRLFDATAPPTSLSAQLIDSFDYKSSSGSGITFQRIPDGQDIWTTGSASLDKYNLTGLSCKYEPTPTDSPTPILTEIPSLIPTETPTLVPSETPTPTPGESISATPGVSLTPTPTPTTTPTPEVKAIYLSEIYPYPDTDEKEWIELFNDNEFSVILDNWKIDDVADSGSSPKKISITIPGYSFKVIDLSSSMFNNDGDEVRLLNANDTVVDSFSYAETEKEKSIGRISFESNSYCLQDPSKGYSNNSCIINETPTPTQSPTPTTTPTPTKAKGVVLGATISADKRPFEPVRPTHSYRRPEQSQEEIDVPSDDKKENKNPSEDRKTTVVRSASILSTIVSILTAGFLFIRILL